MVMIRAWLEVISAPERISLKTSSRSLISLYPSVILSAPSSLEMISEEDELWISSTWSRICLVRSAMSSARRFTSLATTANRFPLSPALAASRAALKAITLVWSVMVVMVLTMSRIRDILFPRVTIPEIIPSFFSFMSPILATLFSRTENPWFTSSSILAAMEATLPVFSVMSAAIRVFSPMVLTISSTLAAWLFAVVKMFFEEWKILSVDS